MTSLGFSSISHANQILQPNFAGGANPSGAHFVNPGPQFSSIVGGVTGCGGAGGSAAALAGKPGHNFVAKQSGGKTHRRGGYKRSQRKRSQNKKRSCRFRGRCHRRKSNKRQRGGLGAFSPASFSGANPPYHQYMGNIPSSNNFSVGAESLSPAMSGMANPGPITVFPNCAAQ
jgi:hypothetical protein